MKMRMSRQECRCVTHTTHRIQPPWEKSPISRKRDEIIAKVITFTYTHSTQHKIPGSFSSTLLIVRVAYYLYFSWYIWYLSSIQLSSSSSYNICSYFIIFINFHRFHYFYIFRLPFDHFIHSYSVIIATQKEKKAQEPLHSAPCSQRV